MELVVFPQSMRLTTLKSRRKINLKGIRKKSSEKGRSQNQKYDPERFYGLFNNKLILIQYQQFEKILKIPENLQKK